MALNESTIKSTPHTAIRFVDPDRVVSICFSGVVAEWSLSEGGGPPELIRWADLDLDQVHALDAAAGSESIIATWSGPCRLDLDSLDFEPVGTDRSECRQAVRARGGVVVSKRRDDVLAIGAAGDCWVAHEHDYHEWAIIGLAQIPPDSVSLDDAVLSWHARDANSLMPPALAVTDDEIALLHVTHDWQWNLVQVAIDGPFDRDPISQTPLGHLKQLPGRQQIVATHDGYLIGIGERLVKAQHRDGSTIAATIAVADQPIECLDHLDGTTIAGTSQGIEVLTT